MTELTRQQKEKRFCTFALAGFYVLVAVFIMISNLPFFIGLGAIIAVTLAYYAINRYYDMKDGTI